jgi:hypothetical protein
VNTNQITGTPSMEPALLEENAAPTIRLIRTYLSAFEPDIELDLKHGCWALRVPCPPRAEYQFSLHGQVEGERQISARLTRCVQRHHFWYSAMELAAFRDDASALEEVFHQRVGGLLESPTRIIEKKGIVWLSYRAEYQSRAGWQNLGGVSYLGIGLGVPFIGKKHVYSSPQIAVGDQR